MKHILNNLSNEEKNSIREQHTGGMNVMTESFSRLLNAKLGDSKPLVNEAEEDDDSGVVVDTKKIESEDMKCFTDISAEEAKKVGLNHGGKYKVKKKGCSTKTRYKGPKQKYSGRSFPGMG
jgi:hypothetical protein